MWIGLWFGDSAVVFVGSLWDPWPAKEGAFPCSEFSIAVANLSFWDQTSHLDSVVPRLIAMCAVPAPFGIWVP